MAVSSFARSLQTVAEDLAAVRPEIMVSVPRLYEKFYARVLAKVEEDGGLKKAIFHWALGVGREASRCRQQGGEPRGLLALKNGIADRLVFRKIRARMGGRLRFFISGGAPLSREIAEFLHAIGVLILEGYGLTETSTVATVNRLERYKFGTVGKALPGTEIRIAADGEILVRGPHIFREYFNDPAATREAIEPDGWFTRGTSVRSTRRGSSASPTGRRTSSSHRGGRTSPPRTWRIFSRTTGTSARRSCSATGRSI
jgi:long-chain acyl-CoA synthetase